MIDSALGAMVVVTDAELRIRMISETGSTTVPRNGYSGPHNALIGASLLDQVTGLDHDLLSEVCAAILAEKTFSGGAKSFRKVVVTPGFVNERWVLVLGPAVGKNGRVDGVVFARFRSSESLGEAQYSVDSARFYEGLVENAGDVIVLVDRDGIIRFINRRVEHYGSMTVDDVLGKHFSEFVHPDDVGACREMMRAVAATKEPFSDFRMRVAAPDGSTRSMVANGSLISAGDEERLLAICRDVTESIELQENLLARNRALSSLNAIVVALSTSASQDNALQTALEKILSALDLEIGAIMLRDPDGGMRVGAYSRASIGSHNPLAREVALSLSRLCNAIGEPVVVRDVRSDECITPATREAMLQIGVEAGIAVPLRCGGPITAILTLAMPAPADLTLEQMEFVNLSAGILGPVIENARLQNDLADRVHRLAMLERLAKSINAGRDVHTVLNACLHEIAYLVEYDEAVVVLVEGNGEAEVFRFSRDGLAQPAERAHLTVEQLDRLAGMQAPVVFPDLSLVAPFQSWGFLAFEHGSGLCARLTYKGKGFGLLNVWSRDSDRFGEREVEILEAAAEHLAIAVSNARLYEAERVKSLQLEALAKEAQHRIKNNLQMITGLLSMSEADTEGGSKSMSRCLRQIRSIATIHDLLNMDNMSGMLALREVLRSIANSAVIAAGRADIELAVSGGDTHLSADSATALGIIVNELINNAIEHGLKDQRPGRIEVRIGTVGKHTVVEVVDNGSGLPPDFVISRNSDSVSGLALVTSLAMYGLGGKLEIRSGEDGTHVAVKF